MANYDNQQAHYGTQARSVPAVDEGLRNYMLRIYNYMAAGLVITGVAAYGTYASGLVYSLVGSPLMWVVALAPLGLVMFLSFRIGKMSFGAAQATFWIFAALLGLSLSTIFLVFTATSITQVFLISAAMFGAMSIWGYTTRRDLTGMGSFLMMGLIGLIIAMIVNIFLQSSAIGFAVSVIGVLIFVGLTAYDTQKIKEMYYVNDDATVSGRKAIMGALRLYLDFINIFLFMLQLFGNRN